MEKLYGELEGKVEAAKPLIDDSLVLCELCFETYNAEERKPLVLNCGHTYCKECINKIMKSNPKLCPTCKN